MLVDLDLGEDGPRKMKEGRRETRTSVVCQRGFSFYSGRGRTSPRPCRRRGFGSLAGANIGHDVMVMVVLKLAKAGECFSKGVWRG